MTFREKSENIKPGKISTNGKSVSHTPKSKWEYSASPEAKDHVQIKRKYDLFINGKWVKGNIKKEIKFL